MLQEDSQLESDRAGTDPWSPPFSVQSKELLQDCDPMEAQSIEGQESPQRENPSAGKGQIPSLTLFVPSTAPKA